MTCCKKCGLILDRRWNRRFKHGEAEGFCNKKCKDKYLNPREPKQRKKYGVGGYIYD